MKKWSMIIILSLLSLVASFMLGAYLSSTDQHRLNDNILGIPIGIQSGSREALIDALDKTHLLLTVDVYYLPGWERGLQFEPLISVSNLLKYPANYIHVEHLNEIQEGAVGRLSSIVLANHPGDIDKAGQDPIAPVLYFQLNDRVSNRVLYSFSFGTYSHSMWVNGYVNMRDSAFIDIVKPFLPLADAVSWTDYIRQEWERTSYK